MGHLKVEVRMVYRIRSSKLGILQSVVMRGVVQGHHDAGDVLLREDEGKAPTLYPYGRSSTQSKD